MPQDFFLCGPNNSCVDPRMGEVPKMVGKPTYGFVHWFCTWFWSWWFSTHGILQIWLRELWLCFNIGLTQWSLWMLWHVYICVCVCVCYNIERNIMKNQSGSLGFGIQGEIFVFICFMFSSLFIFLFEEFICRQFLYRVKTYSKIPELSQV